jgi:hypothetical protein
MQYIQNCLTSRISCVIGCCTGPETRQATRIGTKAMMTVPLHLGQFPSADPHPANRIVFPSEARLRHRHVPWFVGLELCRAIAPPFLHLSCPFVCLSVCCLGGLVILHTPPVVVNSKQRVSSVALPPQSTITAGKFGRRSRAHRHQHIDVTLHCAYHTDLGHHKQRFNYTTTVNGNYDRKSSWQTQTWPPRRPKATRRSRRM